MKIYLSPSMQDYNRYAYGDTTEMRQCYKIAQSAERALKRCGFEVKCAAMGQSAEDNVAESNAYAADFHIPIHTNAGGGKGCVVFVSALEGEKYNFARAVFNALDEITPYSSVYGVRAQSFYEIKAAKSPCIYVECEFHDNAELAKWIIENTDKLGEAICRGICTAAGKKYIAEDDIVERWQSLKDIPKGYQEAAKRYIDKGALKGKADGGLDITEDMLRVMEIMRRYFEEA